MDATHFWESRARRFASRGAGLKAVCSYAMPEFYNRAIDWTQRAALGEILESIRPSDAVLDYGCGIGRWSLEIARRGAQVTSVDFSAAMLSEAETRIRAAGASTRCRFVRADVTKIELDDRFDVIIGVTVLQHVLADGQLAEAIARLARHLKPGGRLIMVEAAPSLTYQHCDTATFQARTLPNYVAKAEAAGLQIVAIQGLDPAPFKLWVIPRFRRWPRPLAVAALFLATAISLPFDLLLAKALTGRSWHKIIVAKAPDAPA